MHERDPGREAEDEEAYEAYLAAVDEGERPEVEVFLARWPHSSPALKERLVEFDRLLGVREPRTTGQELPGILLGERLGAGGMGEVYRGRDLELERDVAVKVLPPVFVSSAARVARFRREARLLASLDHPGIARVHGLVRSRDGHPCLVMELVEGEDLARRLQRGPLGVDELFSIAGQLAAALEAAHRRGVVHRDLKPANVMVTAGGAVKVLDFGLAKRRDEDVEAPSIGALSAEGQVLGTPGYMSPEQALGLEVDERADVYAFGCLVHECATGERYHGSADPARIPAAYPAELRALLRRCLAFDPEERLRDVAEVRSALETMARGEPPAACSIPTPLTSFIGRADLSSELERLLEERRLVTLLGPGGTGKSRLALELARRWAERGRRVVFVELAEARDDAGVASAALSALGRAEESGREPMETLLDTLAASLDLLILDNCEHLLGGAGELARDALQRASRLFVLATSRESLALTGEQVLPVPPLALPRAESEKPELDALERCEAVRLFVERAVLADPEFRLGEENRRAVVEICRRLDGLPLAIELAATRVRVLGIEQVANRIDDALRLCQGGDRTALEHHRTLRATIEWSHDLLSPAERVLFRRFAVFRGGWTLEAAEAVCQVEETFEALSRLVDRSLVAVEHVPGGVRYRLLETLRHYAYERADEAGELRELADRHAEFFLRRAVEAGAQRLRAERIPFFERLELDRDNLAEALAHFRSDEGFLERTLRAAIALLEFWLARGHLRYASELADELLERAGEESRAELRSPLARTAGAIAHRLGHPERAETLYESSLALAREIGDRRLEARTRRQLGFLRSHLGRLDEAVADLEPALEIFRELDDRYSMSIVLNDLGIVANYGARHEDSNRYYRESLALRRELGDEWGIASSLGNLGEVAVLQGDLPLGRRWLGESLAMFRALGDMRSICESLEMNTALEIQSGNLEVAVRLAGAAETQREKLAIPIPPAEREPYQAELERARARLGAERFARLWEEGRRLTVDASVDLALADSAPG